MPDIINAGAILVKEATPLPDALQFESEPCVPGWRLVKDLDGYGLDRKIHEAGWTFFCLAGETKATVFGIDGEKMARRAIERILANPKSERFNSLEIVCLALVASKRFLGVRYLTVSAESRHIQESLFLFPAEDQVPSKVGCRLNQSIGLIGAKDLRQEEKKSFTQLNAATILNL